MTIDKYNGSYYRDPTAAAAIEGWQITRRADKLRVELAFYAIKRGFSLTNCKLMYIKTREKF